MSEVAKPRPEFRNLNALSDLPGYRWPLAALVSGMHRISGVLMFLLLPFILWIFDKSVSSEISFGQFTAAFTAGLGIFPGSVQRFPAANMRGADGSRLKVPHMGWNTVAQKKPHPLWAGIADHSRFYFVHSYCVQAPDSALCAGTTDYGLSFTSAVAQDNIFAVQFHPEKSARDGLQLLKNFVEWHP